MNNAINFANRVDLKQTKSYASEKTAIAKIEAAITAYLGGDETRKIRYMILVIEERFVPVVLFTEYLAIYKEGGFLGPFASQGFMQA